MVVTMLTRSRGFWTCPTGIPPVDGAGCHGSTELAGADAGYLQPVAEGAKASFDGPDGELGVPVGESDGTESLAHEDVLDIRYPYCRLLYTISGETDYLSSTISIHPRLWRRVNTYG